MSDALEACLAYFYLNIRVSESSDSSIVSALMSFSITESSRSSAFTPELILLLVLCLVGAAK